MNSIEQIIAKEPIPKVVKVRQHFDGQRVDDVAGTLRDQLKATPGLQQDLTGKSIAVAVGSRGIVNLPVIVRTVVGCLKDCGATPFLFPAMGSHGGATAEGQKAMLAKLGVTEESAGCPIRATMEVVELGRTEKDVPVVLDRYADGADGLVIINRIKPHVGFRGPYESGLMKMLAIGCGKQAGAENCHNLGFGEMAENIPAIGKVILKKNNFLFGVGLIENAYHETARIEVLTGDEIIEKEPALLEEAKAKAPRLLFDELDVLIMDEIGKNISGTGFDTGVVGRYHTPYIWGGPSINKIGVLDLTDVSGGNANGVGIVDFTTKRLFDKFDPLATYPNSLTSTIPLTVKMPMVLASDKLLIQAAVRTCNLADKTACRLVRIKNTIALSEIEVSESLLAEVRENPGLEILSEPYELPFDADGNLL